MGFDQRIAFLRKLDSAVWVEKRLYPARLIVLDEIEGDHRAQEFVVGVIKTLPQTLNVMDSLPSTDDYHFLETVALETRKQLDTKETHEKYPLCAFSTLEQFLSDLSLYGLREALAYLFEDPEYAVDERLEKLMADGYRDVGQRFLRHSRLIQKRLHETYSRFIESKGEALPRFLDRLIVGDAVNYGDPWADGQRQENLASSEQ
jgi:hypothetical protein